MFVMVIFSKRHMTLWMEKMSNRRLRPGVVVREYDTSTIINPPANVQQLYEYLDQGIEIRGHDGHVVLGKVDGKYIIPEHIMDKLESINIPKDEFDDYLDRLGYE